MYVRVGLDSAGQEDLKQNLNTSSVVPRKQTMPQLSRSRIYRVWGGELEGVSDRFQTSFGMLSSLPFALPKVQKKSVAAGPCPVSEKDAELKRGDCLSK